MLRRWRAILVGAWLCSLPIQTYSRVQLWHSEPALWAEAAQRAPYKPRVLINYGQMLERDARYPDALTAYLHADAIIDQRPTQSPVYLHIQAEVDIIDLMIGVGRYEEAQRALITMLHGPYANAMRVRKTYALLQFIRGGCTMLPSHITAPWPPGTRQWYCPAGPSF